MDYLIWWVSEQDCEKIDQAGLVQEEENWSGTVERRWVEGLPEYINVEFWSRNGRPGRSRLWVHPSLDLPSGFRVGWDVDSTGARKTIFYDYGGIVIRTEDKPVVIALPGFVTDLNLRLIGE